MATNLNQVQAMMAAHPEAWGALASDPQAQQIVLQWANTAPGPGGANMATSGAASRALTARAQQLGVPTPQGMAWSPAGLSSTGGFQPWQLALIVAGGMGLAAAAGIGAGAAAGGSSAASGGGAATGAGMTAVDSAATIPAGGGFVASGVGSGAATGAAGAGAAAATSPSWLPPVLNAGAKALQGASTGASSAAAQQAQYDLLYDQLGLNKTNVNNQAVLDDIAQRQYLDNLYTSKAHQDVYGGALQGTQDINITPPPGVQMGTVTGGLRPSGITNKDQIGAELQRNAQMELLNPQQPGGLVDANGKPITSAPNTLPSFSAPPALSAPSTSTGLPLGLSVGGDTLSLLALLQQQNNKAPTATNGLTPNVTPGNPNPVLGAAG